MIENFATNTFESTPGLETPFDVAGSLHYITDSEVEATEQGTWVSILD